LSGSELGLSGSIALAGQFIGFFAESHVDCARLIRCLHAFQTERDHSSPTSCRVPPAGVRENASRFSVSCCDQGSYQVDSHGSRASAGGGYSGKIWWKPGRGFANRVEGYVALNRCRRQVAAFCVVQASGSNRPTAGRYLHGVRGGIAAARR
jgi:hypothetical protein